MHIRKNGTQNAYRKRGLILREVIKQLDPKKMREINGGIYVDCNMNVCELAQRLFSDLPNGKFSLICNRGCPRRERELAYTFLPNELLNETCTSQSMYNHFMQLTNCNGGCLEGMTDKVYEASGNFV